MLNALALSRLTSPSIELHDHKLETRISKLCKFDKGNGLAILEVDDYFLKLDKIIEDGSKIVEIELQDGAIHPIIQKQKFDSILRQKISDEGWWLCCPNSIWE